MPGHYGDAIASAIALTIAVLLPFPATSQSQTADAVRGLEEWLDRNSDLPAAPHPPVIRLAARDEISTPSELAGLIGKDPRGFYDPQTASITLVRPWRWSDVQDRAVLLHELAHHRQSAKHYYCPAAQEFAAYKLQEKWLRERDQTLDVNWIAIVLASSCAARDIHPD